MSSLASHLASKKVAPNSKLDTKRGDVQVYYRWRICLCFQNSLIQAKVKEQLASCSWQQCFRGLGAPQAAAAGSA